MLPHDPTGKTGPRKPLPDSISIAEPKEEKKYDQPVSESFDQLVCGDRTTNVRHNYLLIALVLKLILMI